jgi:uncharacterized protein (TIGR02453 family)
VAFAGVPKETFAFLRGLAANNDRAWFQAHRDDYEAYWLEPAMALVEAIGSRLRRFAPDVVVDPRVNGSIFRINRDIRFSKDKRPYKTHLDLWFPETKTGQKWAPGYWFRLTPDAVSLGAGMHGLDAAMLDRFRQAVGDDERGPALASAVAKVRKAGYEVWGEHYKRVPRGFEPDHPRADLLRYDSLTAGGDLPAEEARSPRFPDLVASHYRKLAPIQRWLVDVVNA